MRLSQMFSTRNFLMLMFCQHLLACNNSQFSSGMAPLQAPKDETKLAQITPEDNQTTIGMTVGQSVDVADIPDAGSGELASFNSDDPSVASIDEEGNIIAVAPGKATIKIIYADGSTAIIEVEVSKSEVDASQARRPTVETPILPSTPELPRPEDMIGRLNDEDSADAPILIFDEPFVGSYLSKSLAPDSRVAIWAVTSAGKATWMRLEGDKVVEKRSWTGLAPASSGSRTYVTEGGIVIARTGGYLYWIDPDKTPQGALPQAMPHLYRLPNVQNSDRVCIVSYRKNKQRYIGMGWGQGHFVEFSMENLSPFAPQWGKVTGQVKVDIAGFSWGYSCFIDQERLIYYGQALIASVSVGAVDLMAMKVIDPKSVAPNAKFVSNNLRSASLSVNALSNGSYALNGDTAGNVFNGTGYYTMAFDRATRTVWASQGATLHVLPDKCLYSEPNCKGHAVFSVADTQVAMGPLSSIGDGRMIGINRSPSGRVYLMKLKEKKDITRGITVTPIADLDGDPYMYTDFTGATLYLTHSTTTFELNQGMKFDPNKLNRAVGFTWLANPGSDPMWREIKLEIRCYMAEAEAGGFSEVKSVNPATKQTVIRTDECAGKAYNRVDIRLTQLEDGDSLTKIARIQVTAYQ